MLPRYTQTVHKLTLSPRSMKQATTGLLRVHSFAPALSAVSLAAPGTETGRWLGERRLRRQKPVRVSSAGYSCRAASYLVSGICSCRHVSSRLFSTSTSLLKDDEPPEKPPTHYIPPDPSDPDRFRKLVKFDMEQAFLRLSGRTTMAKHEATIFPQFCDILIVGGGILGSLIAFYIKNRIPGPRTLNIVVVEKDPSYASSASTHSFGAIRTQFSQEANVKAALYGAEFLRTMKEHLSYYDQVSGDSEFTPQGFLFLGSESDVAQMQINQQTQLKAGAKVALMKTETLRQKYPWLNLDGIALGSYGLEHEGWYDTWKLLYAVKVKNMAMGIHYVDGEATGFEYDDIFPDGHRIAGLGGTYVDKLKKCVVKTQDHGTQKIQFSFCVNAAGADSGRVAAMAGIGYQQRGVRCIQLPVERRKRYLFSFHCPEGPRLSFPILVDPNGISVRREGLKGMYICSFTPKTNDEEPDPGDLTVPEGFFSEVIWPKLAFRVPVFSKLQLRGSWAHLIDYNYFDQSGIIGPHVYHGNFLFATGFSGYGVGIAPAIGRAIMDYIYEARYENIDMTPFEFMRFINWAPMKEMVIV